LGGERGEGAQAPKVDHLDGHRLAAAALHGAVRGAEGHGAAPKCSFVNIRSHWHPRHPPAQRLVQLVVLVEELLGLRRARRLVARRKHAQSAPKRNRHVLVGSRYQVAVLDFRPRANWSSAKRRTRLRQQAN